MQDGTVFIGTNACASPQAECPRTEGEGYEKCKTVCGQYGHAEETAVRAMQRMHYTGEDGSVFEVGDAVYGGARPR